ncbi:MAG: T9SS type A sorting domain-containing protein [Cryomorphaceae bacterium]
MTVLDQTGRIVLQSASGGDRMEIGHLPSGLYFLRIETAEGTAVQKLIKL